MTTTKTEVDIYDLVKRTPLDQAKKLSDRLGVNVWLKREDLQPVFSFKLRGAYYRMLQLSDEEKEQGVIAASAGNHAQGVAYSAQKLGIDATIVMPQTTPEIKVSAVKGMGANVVLHGDSYDDAQNHAIKLVESSGLIFIHPFDDEEVIKGQGTIGHELVEQLESIDYVFIPVGGGGLISGVGEVLKELSPKTKIIGVEPTNSNAMEQSLNKKKLVRLDKVGIFADGVAVKEVGENTFSKCLEVVDEIITVTTDEICAGIRDVHSETRTIVEPAGALSAAGIVKYFENNDISGVDVVGINSGANMTFERLQFVAERTMTGSHKEALYNVTLAEKPGALRAFCEEVVNGYSITEFNYRQNHENQADIFVGIGISSEQDKADFEASLDKYGYDFFPLTNNELAKQHVRHMVGGVIDKSANELLYSFHFPEKAGALQNFLNDMKVDWSISLFHYRWIGGDIGRVLIGFEIKEGDEDSFHEFLDKTGYEYQQQTNNKAYKAFLTKHT